jgi:hypothetical protein
MTQSPTIEVTATLTPEVIAAHINRDPRGKLFIESILAELDSDRYHACAEYIKGNPDGTIECPHCHKHTWAFKGRFKERATCDHCGRTLP